MCRNRTSAREELRLQLGTLRFDLNILASALDKPKKKAAEAAKKAFLSKVRCCCCCCCTACADPHICMHGFVDRIEIFKSPAAPAAKAAPSSIVRTLGLPCRLDKLPPDCTVSDRHAGFRDSHVIMRAACAVQADELDYAIRKKDLAAAQSAYAAAKSALDSAIASVA